MQVIVNEKGQVRFPCLMENDNGLVIFALGMNGKHLKGIAVKNYKESFVAPGDFSSFWLNEDFKEIDIESLRSKEEEEINFPCLMKDKDGTFIVAVGWRDNRRWLAGFSIFSKEETYNNIFSHTWNPENFKKLHGEITLKSDGDA
jgi:hypothetical protein